MSRTPSERGYTREQLIMLGGLRVIGGRPPARFWITGWHPDMRTRIGHARVF